ncbi:MAG: YggS family pyridoxal phosphate-dependent enzyme [Vampirovibrionales bacterium]|nr:YggS family pyridoxal phosphate-dependent enzyme [Vampirovibrionales bacterium]
MNALTQDDFEHRLAALRQQCDARGATLLAVTKGASLAQIRRAWALGVRDVGENRVQDALAKMEALNGETAQSVGSGAPGSLRWHLIGHLQGNKVAKTVGRFHLIHSIDTTDLAQRLSDANASRNCVQAILLQINVAQEPQKYGFAPEALPEALSLIRRLPGVRVEGLMAMTPLRAEAEESIKIFTKLYDLRMALSDAFARTPARLSMGMSQDYIHALACGATIVRVGSFLFGEERVRAL